MSKPNDGDPHGLGLTEDVIARAAELAKTEIRGQQKGAPSRRDKEALAIRHAYVVRTLLRQILDAQDVGLSPSLDAAAAAIATQLLLEGLQSLGTKSRQPDKRQLQRDVRLARLRGEMASSTWCEKPRKQQAADLGVSQRTLRRDLGAVPPK